MDNCNLSFNDKLLFLIGFIYIFEVTLSGLIRYIFSHIGLTFLIYLPKALLLLGIIYALIIKFKIKKFSFFISILLIFSIEVSLLNNNNLNEIILGIWILLPFFYGILLGKNFINCFYRYRKYFFVLWITLIIGVIINVFYQWPWIGSSYEIGSLKLTASREWSTGGISRLSGFGRVSASTASETLLLAIILIFSFKNLFFKMLIWIISGIIIILTTTKTVILIWLIITLLFIIIKIINLNKLMFLPIFLSILIIIFPFYSNFFYNIFNLGNLNYYQTITFASFLDRLSFTWPWTLEVINKLGSPIFGIGIGGIGTPYKLFNPTFYSPVDNLSLYLYGLFGIFGIIIIIFSSIKFFIDRNKYSYSEKLIIFYFFISVLLEGFTLSVMEFPFFSFMFGIVLANIFSTKNIKGKNCKN